MLGSFTQKLKDQAIDAASRVQAAATVVTNAASSASTTSTPNRPAPPSLQHGPGSGVGADASPAARSITLSDLPDNVQLYLKKQAAAIKRFKIENSKLSEHNSELLQQVSEGATATNSLATPVSDELLRTQQQNKQLTGKLREVVLKLRQEREERRGKGMSPVSPALAAQQSPASEPLIDLFSPEPAPIQVHHLLWIVLFVDV